MKYLLLLILFFRLLLVNAQFTSDSITFFFDHDSSIPLENSTIIDKIKASGKITEIQLVAYTDTTGTVEYNQKLAIRRAEAVKKILPASLVFKQIIIEGESSKFGNDENNRRVDIRFNVPVEGRLEREVLNLNIEFVGNQAIVLERSYPKVDELVAKIKNNTYTKIEIHGHVCCRADMSLSLQRAETIRNIMIENGIDESIISSFGHSNLQPRFPEYDEENRQKNRRVEVVLIRSEMKY